MTETNRVSLKGPLVVAATLAPLVLLAIAAFRGQLGANPIEAVIHSTGDWGLRFLLLTLAIAPLRYLLNWPQIMFTRPILGRVTFLYAFLHALAYVGLDQFFDVEAILHDIVKRPFITLGFVAFVVMIPLAVTSNRRSQQRLGANWQRLHQLIYLVAICAVLHYWALVKADTREPAIYGAILAVLLAQKLWVTFRGRGQKRPGVASPPPV